MVFLLQEQLQQPDASIVEGILVALDDNRQFSVVDVAGVRNGNYVVVSGTARIALMRTSISSRSVSLRI